MKKYEGLFIFPAEGDKDYGTDAAKWIEKFQGKILHKNELGKKTLGHPLAKSRDGKVYVFDFEMDSSRMQDFRKDLELQEALLKYMITVQDPKKAKAIATLTGSKKEPTPAA